MAAVLPRYLRMQTSVLSTLRFHYKPADDDVSLGNQLILDDFREEGYAEENVALVGDFTLALST